MQIIYQAILARLDVESQHVRPLASSRLFEAAGGSSNISTTIDSIPATADICSLVEQKVSQELTDEEIKSIVLSQDFDLYYQVNVEREFSVCFMCVTSKDLNADNVVVLFDNMRNAYLEVEYIRSSIKDSSLGDLPQFQRFINREVENLNQKMDQQKSTRVSQLQQEVDQVKTVMSDNVLRVMERGERLENLDQRAESLEQSSAAFKTSARRVQRNMCFKNLKWTILLGLVITLLIVLGITLILKTAGVI